MAWLPYSGNFVLVAGEYAALESVVQRGMAVGFSCRRPHALFALTAPMDLRALIASGALIRVKGRLWLPGKARPLQIQGVGPRLECWFEADDAPGSPNQDGLDLVVLGFGLKQDQLESNLKEALT
jgi:G3E family GTPase